MNPPKCNEYDYINFLVATPKSYSCVEGAKVHPLQENPPAHDAFNRLLYRLPPDPEKLWEESQPFVHPSRGVLVIDDSTLDKPYAQKIELVTRHWSGKHHDVVLGINLITLLWSDGDCHIPCDYRIYDKSNDGLSKNDHFQSLISQAHARGFSPQCVVFDSWYSSLKNLKILRRFGWHWLTRLKSNRLVDLDQQGNRPLSQLPISENGTVVHLKGYGFIKVFKIVTTDGDIEFWATSYLQMNELFRLKYAEISWAIEEYHRGIKQFVGVERCMLRQAKAQRNHIGLALRAFLRLERYCFKTGLSWFEAKTSIIREAVRAYLANPMYTLTPTVSLNCR
jgi:hypothetical protein